MKREAGNGPFKKIVPLCENIFCKEGQIKEDLMTTWRQLKIERERICVRLSVSWREREREREWRQTSIAYCVRVSDVGKCVEEREREHVGLWMWLRQSQRQGERGVSCWWKCFDLGHYFKTLFLPYVGDIKSYSNIGMLHLTNFVSCVDYVGHIASIEDYLYLTHLTDSSVYAAKQVLFYRIDPPSVEKCDPKNRQMSIKVA